jgi:cytochrome c
MKSTTFFKPTIFLLSILVFSCGEGEKTTEKSAEATPVETQAPAPIASVEPSTSAESQTEAVSAKDSQELTGEDKVADSDCLSCHMVERKVIGPSYLDVAAEYENNEANVAMLAKKIIEGGVGVWGEVMMPPHATLSEEDAKDMVRYILSLQPH